MIFRIELGSQTTIVSYPKGKHKDGKRILANLKSNSKNEDSGEAKS